MVEDKIVLTYGALLHDIGKVVIRGQSESGTHSVLGARFLSQDVAPINEAFAGEAGKRIIEQVRFHHAREMNGAPTLPSDSLAYITYFADNISAGMDRKNEGEESSGYRFDKAVKLRKIFNILNGRHDDNVVEHEDYNAIRERIRQGLASIQINELYVNSVLNLLEATTDTVPSSTDLNQLVDVSLYDHAKTTAGIAACIYDYLAAMGVDDYHSALFSGEASRKYYDEPMFLLYSCDMSGIQDFIYNISGKGALKQLRARSMYLELLLEHIVDELLSRLELSRANLLYTGGGHAYLLLPNTQKTLDALEAFSNELQEWFVETYRTDLYVASAWVACSANDLMNEGPDKTRYPSLFRRLSQRLSDAKVMRYSAQVLYSLNYSEDHSLLDNGRECTECHRSDLHLDQENKCTLCSALGRISRELIRKDVFAVERGEADGCHEGLALPFGFRLVMYSRDAYLAKKPDALRVYTKNAWDTGLGLATHIWMGDYTAESSTGISGYADDGTSLEPGRGISRLGVLRADVDNLGATFVNGLPADKVSISRTATLSRALNLFFKRRINSILSSGEYRVQIIYSGGDDLFLLGNWSDVLYAAIDIRHAFDEFTGNGSLTLSAGVGMYDSKYPIARMAKEVGELEDAAKLHVSEDGTAAKNAIALWTQEAVFEWGDFINEVEPRMRSVARAFDENEKGKAFVYRLIELLRNADDAISAPRIAYLLARSFEGTDRGSAASTLLYKWAMDSRERRRLVAAIEWYVYSARERS